MVVVMSKYATKKQIQKVIRHLTEKNFEVHRSTGVNQTVLGAVGERREFDPSSIETMDGVQEVVRITEPYKLVGRGFHPQDSVIQIKGVHIGGHEVVAMAGPCSVESEEQMDQIAAAVGKAGAKVLRGGAFKPRTSPYSFQGLGEKGLKILRKAADRYGLLTISEVMDSEKITLVTDYVDILQVGTRSMQNYNLLRQLGKIRKPVLLKRGFAATIEEMLLSAEYIMSGGNYEVILCERGIRTFEQSARNTLDISAIPTIQKLSHLPIIVDPSHATGRRDKVTPMARAGIAAGADGLLIEVHHDPENALSDGQQSLYPQQFENLMHECSMIANVLGKTMTYPKGESALALA